MLPGIITRPGKPAITIVKYPEGVPCVYSWVIDMTKRILPGDRAALQGSLGGNIEPDLIVHMGMRGRTQPEYVFETLARKEGYDRPGQDGVRFPREMVEPGGEWVDLPEKLFTEIDMERMRTAVLSAVPVGRSVTLEKRTMLINLWKDVDIQVSDKAGLYFCEFELWAALAELRLQGLPGKAVFVHIPQGNSQNDIRLGGKVVEELLCAIFHSEGRT